jgi:hypothetical protein
VHCVAGVAGKQKRGLRVLREPHLVVKPNPQLKAKRTPSRSTPGPPTSQEWWGIAMTTVMGEGVGWGAIVLALDGYPQQLVGDDAGVPWTARHGLAALDLAASRQVPEGARDPGLSWRRDHGCPPSALACRKACSPWGIQQAVTRDHNATGHAATERVRRTRKEDGLWRQEWPRPLAVIGALEGWMAADKAPSLPCALGSRSPRQVDRHDDLSHGTPFVAA